MELPAADRLCVALGLLACLTCYGCGPEGSGDGRPLVVLARTDPCRGMEPIRRRGAKLHYVRITSDDERQAFRDLLDEL